MTVKRKLVVGDFVMEHDPYLDRGQRSTGHAVKVHPESDSLVTTVYVKLNNGVFQRGIRHLCLMEPSLPNKKQTGSGNNGSANSTEEKDEVF